MLPPNVTHLQLKKSELKAPRPASGELPPSITHLALHCGFMNVANLHSLQQLEIHGRIFGGLDNLPGSLQRLFITDHEFNLPIDALPPALTHLYFCADSGFNRPVNSLPTGLTHLILGCRFNMPLDQLPPSLVFLQIHNSEEQNAYLEHPIVLPQSLKYLSIARIIFGAFEQLPPALTHLELQVARAGPLPPSLTHYVVVSIDGALDELPPLLTFLALGTNFNKNIDDLPDSLTHLVVGTLFHLGVDHLPPRLTHLSILSMHFNAGVDYLPETLVFLRIGLNQGDNFNQAVDYLPPSLLSLQLGYSFNQPLDHLPHTLTKLIIDSRMFNQPIDHLPPSLKSLTLFSTFLKRSIDHLPPALTELSLDSATFDERYPFLSPLDHLPPSLTSLTIGSYKQSLDYLPRSLTTFKSTYNLLTEHLDHLPRLTYLDLGPTFDHSIDNLPETLNFLAVGNWFRKHVHHLPRNLSKFVHNSDTKKHRPVYLPPGCKYVNEITEVYEVHEAKPKWKFMEDECWTWEEQYDP